MKKYKLEDIAIITSSKRIFESEYVQLGVPFIRGQEISDGSIGRSDFKYLCYISKERYNEIKQMYGVPQKDDILITSVGTIGNLYLVKDNREFYFKDGNIIWLKNISSDVFPAFLCYFMKSNEFKKQLKYALIGAVQKALTISMLSKVIINIPDLQNQKKIASVLSTLDRKISINRAINQNLEAMAKQLYDYWFVQFDFPNEKGKPYKSSGGKMVWNEKLKREIPEGWEAVCIKDLIHPIERGISYSSNDLLDFNATPMVNLACFSKSGNYRMGEMKYFSGNIIDSKMILPMDMLTACTDMTQGADIIGRPILVPHEYDQYTFSTDLALIKPLQDDKMFLYQTLRTSFYHDYIRPFASGTNVKHLAIKGVEDYTIALPDIELRMKFDKLTNSMFENISYNINGIASLTKQRDELLPLLMNGQVTVNGD